MVNGKSATDKKYFQFKLYFQFMSHFSRVVFINRRSQIVISSPSFLVYIPHRRGASAGNVILCCRAVLMCFDLGPALAYNVPESTDLRTYVG